MAHDIQFAVTENHWFFIVIRKLRIIQTKEIFPLFMSMQCITNNYGFIFSNETDKLVPVPKHHAMKPNGENGGKTP
jgi:hypothetical protein